MKYSSRVLTVCQTSVCLSAAVAERYLESSFFVDYVEPLPVFETLNSKKMNRAIHIFANKKFWGKKQTTTNPTMSLYDENTIYVALRSLSSKNNGPGVDNLLLHIGLSLYPETLRNLESRLINDIISVREQSDALEETDKPNLSSMRNLLFRIRASIRSTQ